MDSILTHHNLQPVRTRVQGQETAAAAGEPQLAGSPAAYDAEIDPLPGQAAAFSQDRSSGLSSPRHRSSPRKGNRRHGPHAAPITSSLLAPQAGLSPGHFNISASAGHSRSTSEMTTPSGSASTLATSTIPAMMPPGYAPAASFSAYGGEGVKSSGISMTALGQLSLTPDALLELVDKAKKMGVAQSMAGGPDMFLTVDGKKRSTSHAGKKELPKYSNAPPKKSDVETGLTHQWNWIGILIFLFYCAAALYYFVIRATRTLNIGFTGYGWLVLLIEIIASTSTFSYAVLLTKHTRSKQSEGLPPAEHPPDPSNLQFHLRVLIPCYKEKEDVVRRTVVAALEAELPRDTLCSVYLCDDGAQMSDRQAKLEAAIKEGDEKKIKEAQQALAKAKKDFKDNGASREQRELMLLDICREKGLIFGTDLVHVKRTKSGKPETNAKSNNLNNCLQNVIYKEFVEIDGLCKDVEELKKAKQISNSEVIIVLDADMIPEYNFYRKILQPMCDPDMSICLTPQGFYNLPIKEGKKKDIFNSLNLAFWEYMLPGTDAFGYIACTGTNFALRAQPLREVNWFPTDSVTEDYTLGFNLKINGNKGSYLSEYLVYGEAPEEVREIFQQRSRWCKGQMQVLFSRHCPLFKWKLSWRMRLLYTSVTWSYITNTIAVPCNVLVPFIALVFGVYPLVLNRDFALAATLFFTAGAFVSGYCTSSDHLKPMWFTPVSCHLLWFTFTKATINTLISVVRGNVQEFKSTNKKGQEDQKGSGSSWLKPKNLGDMAGTKDHIVIFISFAISFITAAVGVFQMIDRPYTAQGDFKWYLALSIFWAIYNMMPPALFIWYMYDNRTGLENFASFCFILSYIVACCGIACTWLVPDDYNLGQVLQVSLQFFEAQRSGKLPRISNTPWRGNSGLWDSVLLPNGKNYSLLGGWYDDGGMLKLSYTTAFTVSMLSWAYYEFKGGYVASDNLDFGANTIRWGADYLLKAAATNVSSTSSTTVTPIFVAQVGDVTRDRLYWGMPEKSTIPRPASSLSVARPGTDCMAMTSAALAAAAVAVQGESLQVADNYLQKAIEVYKLAQKWRGYYSKYIESGKLYPSVSYFDDLAYAAAWIYLATGDTTYLTDAETYYDQSLSENHVSSNAYMFHYENVVPALDLLLYQLTGDVKYKSNVQGFVHEWMTHSTAADSPVFYTNKGLAKAHPDGTLQHTANAAFYVLVAAKQGIMGQNYMLHACWARNQIGYMLGDAGRSYVTGYGAQPPLKTPHKAASCPPPDVSDCTFESAYYTTDPNYHTLRGGLVGGPDNADQWVDDRNMDDPAVTVSLLNSAGFSATMAGLVDGDINMAKCQQGSGFISTLMRKAKGQPDSSGLRWWEGA